MKSSDCTIWIDINCCVDCGKCTVVCPTDALYMDNGTLNQDQNLCICCGACIDECPYGCLGNS